MDAQATIASRFEIADGARSDRAQTCDLRVFLLSTWEIAVDITFAFMSFFPSWFWLPSSMVEQLTLNQ